MWARVWAMGCAEDYRWLGLRFQDRKGLIRQEAGVADWPGLYVLGATFLTRRNSTYIHGAEDDAREVCEHLSAYLKKRSVA